MLLLSLTLGCYSGDLVTLEGRVYSGPEAAAIVPGARVKTLDFALEVIDEVTADGEGRFEAEARANAALYLHLQGDDHVPTGHSGATGAGTMALESGEIWMRSRAELEALQADFEGCPGAADAGAGQKAAVEGLLVFYAGPEAEEVALATTAYAVAYDEAGRPYDACYFADDPKSARYDPEATQSGHHGRFAIFGVPSGRIELEVGYYAGEAVLWAGVYNVYAPAGGVAPMYPAWLELLI